MRRKTSKSHLSVKRGDPTAADQPGVKSITARAPWLVAFTFGLMHGLGFAGGLSEAGLPAGHVPTALLFFSGGVEAGHFMFIGVVSVGAYILKRRNRRFMYGRAFPRAYRW